MRDVVFIVGMGRSGTSALTRVLALCGCALPLQTLHPNFANPTGFWEPELIVELNDRLLAEHSSSWFDASIALQTQPVTAPQRGAFVAEATTLLEEGFESGGPIVLKDPRISGLLPYWLEAAHAASLRPKVIHIFRQPADVAASLARRDDLPACQSNALWLKYNLIGERDGRGLPRVFVAYEDLMSDWRSLVARCAHRLELDLSLSQEAQDAVAAFLSADLQHHRSAIATADDASLVTRVYRLLEDAVRTGGPDSAAFDELLDAYARGPAESSEG